ncbi:hypothetical protein DAPPUDRAFT_114529 [Daphnia pulex]|uniref:Uncharacterized protein n=1 Tax=Daphnia pulex TaxID=6669 RepID=E9HIF7_DAPPU|nr:hypothetical protein DAPPUDRAFT_114529 [Daphnia pulex]|eukprot:EFX68505.1 hypothetical protein DAPPUDRAFT_114529 [Daphnia pulex]
MAVWGIMLTAATLLEPMIMNEIRYVRPGNDFQTNVTFFRKIEVNGANDHPLYFYLKKSCPTTRDFFEPIARLIYSPLRNNDVRCNFEKFLIDRKGKPVKRYDASTRISDMRVDIESLLFPSVEFVYGSEAVAVRRRKRDWHELRNDTPDLNRPKYGGDLEKKFEIRFDLN